MSEGGPRAEYFLESVLWLGVVLCLGTCGACVVANNFIKINSRSKESECKANLKSAYTAERAYEQEKGTYSVDLREIGFEPERGNRYAYFLSESGVIEERLTSALPPETFPLSAPPHTGIGADEFRYGPPQHVERTQLPHGFVGGVRLGITGTCPDGGYNPVALQAACFATFACAGQLDSDPDLDVWSISTADRHTSDGTLVPAGHSYQELVDRDPTLADRLRQLLR